MNHNNSGYDRNLFERVLLGLNDPTERTRTVLLWRGFLARRDEAGVFLCTGSEESDAELLQQNGLAVRRIDGHRDNCAEILNPKAISEETLFHLFNCAPKSRLPGPFGIDVSFKQDWKTFKRQRFGARLPVALLDPPISLLVKVLSVLGLHVIDACDGHMSNPPYIRLLSTHHLNWAKVVLPIFASRGKDFLRQWSFRTENWTTPRWDFSEKIGVWFLGNSGCGETLEGRWKLYNSILKLSVEIMENTRAHHLRQAKTRLPSSEALERAAELREKLRIISPFISDPPTSATSENRKS